MSHRVYVVAGEISGDIHGAELMAGLKAELGELEFRGVGGPAMVKEGGGGVTDWVDEAAVMGLVEVLKRYSWFKMRFAEVLRDIREMKPEVLLLVDYQEFNHRLAKAVKEEMPEVKVVQYVAPQVWAWNERRIPKVVAALDLMICLFPFEVEYFTKAGLRSVCVGHPLVDELERRRITGERDPWHVGLFPGSRKREVAKLFPLMLKVARQGKARFPEVKFTTAAASPKVARLMHEIQGAEGLIEIQDGESLELMQKVGCGVIASGTATLEASYYGMSYCLVYEVAWGTYLAAKQLLKSRYIGLVNILAKEELAPEFIQGDANEYELTHWLGTRLADPEKAQNHGRILKEAASSLGEPGMHARAALEIKKLLSW